MGRLNLVHILLHRSSAGDMQPHVHDHFAAVILQLLKGEAMQSMTLKRALWLMFVCAMVGNNNSEGDSQQKCGHFHLEGQRHPQQDCGPDHRL